MAIYVILAMPSGKIGSLRAVSTHGKGVKIGRLGKIGKEGDHPTREGGGEERRFLGQLFGTTFFR